MFGIMAPMRVEVQDKNGNWNFGSFAYDGNNLLELMHVVYQDSTIRIYEQGSLTVERNKDGTITDYRMN